MDKQEKKCVAEQIRAWIYENLDLNSLSDEELEQLVPWSDEARIYCGYAQQIACI